MPVIDPPDIVALVAVIVAKVAVPVKEGPAKSALVAIAVAILLNSVSISVPLTILPALPEGSESFDAKSVDFV